MPTHWWTIAFYILHSALFVETWRDLGHWDKICKVMWLIFYSSVWWELETHGHLEKLFSENEQLWQIMWWTLGTEINYGLKQLGHSLFLMELGPHLGLEIVDVWCMHLKRKIPHLFVAKWTHELKVRYEPLITLNLKEFVLLALVSIFIIHYRRLMKIIHQYITPKETLF